MTEQKTYQKQDAGEMNNKKRKKNKKKKKGNDHIKQQHTLDINKQRISARITIKINNNKTRRRRTTNHGTHQQQPRSSSRNTE